MVNFLRRVFFCPKTGVALGLILLTTSLAVAQPGGNRPAGLSTAPATELAEDGTPFLIRLPASEGKLLAATGRQQVLRQQLQLAADDQLRPLRTETDALGFTHERYQQYYKGVKVEHGQYSVHERGGRIESLSGELKRVGAGLSVQPALGEAAALQRALAAVGARRYKWQEPAEEAQLRQQTNDPHATYQPKGELVVVGDFRQPAATRPLVLAWKFNVYAHEPVSRNWLYVDARTGQVVLRDAIIKHVNAPGTMATRYLGTRTSTTDAFAGGYRLRETTRGKGVTTLNCRQGTSFAAAVDFVDGDNHWTAAEYNNAAFDNAALDAHIGAQATQDYWVTQHGRDSYDNRGTVLLSYVHFGNRYENAFWDGTEMVYGDGAARFRPLTALDVCAHEMGHAVCETTADLIYQNESGALNEAFSDIWGACVEHSVDPTKQIWLIGEDIDQARPSLRSMSNPNAEGQPDTYLGTMWYFGAGDNGGVHYNSGVLNFWFYLLSTGGTGTNDFGTTYNVPAITIQKAARIAYRAELLYLTPSSNYSAARTATLQAAVDLYGFGSPEVTAVAQAWRAVGLGQPAPTLSSLVPSSGAVGQTVLLNGTNLSNTFHVTFNGTPVTAGMLVSATQVQVVVPAGATTGPVAVTTPSGTATSAGVFTITSTGPAPTIVSYAPAAGERTGAPVVITGTNFTGASAVTFNGLSAVFTVDTDNQLTTTVPAGASSGLLAVTTPGGTASVPFTVLPYVASFTPGSGVVGTGVTLTGTSFTGALDVKFNGVYAVFTVLSATSITATVPPGAATGRITVRTPSGTATSLTDFTVTPSLAITSFSPTSGAPATTAVTIRGVGFTGTTAVQFNGVSATPVTIASDTELWANVPATATTGRISVTGPLGTVQSSANFVVVIPGAPVITAFAPSSGPVGTQVTLTGTDFAGATAVRFNGVAAAFTVTSSTQLVTTVPASAATGPITVTTPIGTGQSPANFTVVVPPANDLCTATNLPVLTCGGSITGTTMGATRTGDPTGTCGTSLDAAGGVFYRFTGTGGLVTIQTCGGITNYDSKLFVFTGTCGNYGCVTGDDDSCSNLASTVTFQSGSGTEYLVYVAGWSTHEGNFTLSATCTAPPVLTSFVPANGSVGTRVTMNGTNLSGTTQVTFTGATNNTVTTGFTVNGAGTQLTNVVVPSGATTGPVTVTTADGTSNGLLFTVASFTVTSLSPARNARASSPGTVVGVSFSDAVNPATAGNIRVFSQQYRGQRTATVSTSGSTVTLTPTGSPAAAFKPGETVWVSVPATVQSTGGLGATRHVFQFATATSGTGRGAFSGSQEVAVGTSPYGMATGDVDGDGDLDLVAANFTSGTVSVRLNNGSGAFSGTQNVPVGTSPLGLTVGDVDGDGDLDLLAANYSSNTVSVRLNDGTGSFGGSQEVAVGNNPFNVAVGDMDGDGDLDLVAANYSSNTVSVRLNDGTGTFGGSQNVPVGSNPGAIAVSDVDGDGDLDLLAANYAGNAVSVRFNNGTGIFGGTQQVAVGAAPGGVALGDVDGDGDLDLLAANNGSGTVSVCLNDGTGGFSGSQTVPVGSSSYSVALGDVDSDGDLDLLTSNYGNSTVSVRLNNGTGAFGGTQHVAVGSGPFNVVVGDVDGDGDLDFVTPGYDANTVSVRLNQQPAPIITSFSPTSGPVGTSVTVTGTHLAGATAVRVNGTAAVSITNNSATSLTFLVPTGATSGLVSVTTPDGTATTSGLPTPTFTVLPPAPTLSSFAPTSGPVGTVVTLTGTAFGGTTAVYFNGTAAATFTVNSATSLTATVPSGATTGPLSLTTSGGTATNTANFTVTVSDLLVSTAMTLPGGTFNNVTILNGGHLSLTNGLVINGTLRIADGGRLALACFPVAGPGSFELEAGGELLAICDPAGLTLSGNSGAIRVGGTRTYSDDAGYHYITDALNPQVTGPGLPAQVRVLTITSTGPTVSLSQPVAIRRGLALNSDLRTNGHLLTLLSDATATAVVVNSGGVLLGTAAVQRYLDPTLNPGPGYRQYSSPIANTTVADLQTPGFTPVANPAYNTAPRPGTVSPFPTVFGYNQSRLATVTSNLSAFDKGWVSPAALTEALQVGRGYTVHIPASQKVDFVGTLNNGDLTLPLTRNSGTTTAAAGWNLVGNPYPAPLDWSLVAPADRPSLDAGMYVFESTGPYGGQYRAYVNGLGGSPLIASGQGFFVSVSTGQTTGSLTFRNSQRLTSFTTAVPFRRGTADTRPRVQLTLQAPGGLTDAVFVYAQVGATPGLDAQFDAPKLTNPSGLNLSALATTGQPLAVDGRPAFSSTTTVALTLGVPAAGTYTLRAAELLHLPATLDAYLADVLTGQVVSLRQQPSYTFNLTAAQVAQPLEGRFVLRFGPVAAPLAAAVALTGADVVLYPNPAHTHFTVRVPAVAGARQVEAVLLNSLGQKVRQQTAALSSIGATLEVAVRGLAQGVYTLRLQVGPTLVARRVVVQ